MPYAYLFLLLILSVGIFLSVKTQKLTLPAALTGGIVAICIFAGAGFTGIAMLAAFFVFGSVATSWKIKKKEQLFLVEKNEGRRTTSQVLANAGAAGIVGLLSLILTAERQLFELMIAASFASATADTLSSEMGNVYGKNFYNSISFKKDKRGLDGVISTEGTLFGFAGALIIACIFSILRGFNQSFFTITISGLAGNVFDSILGASLQRKGYLNNNSVNFLNTAFAAILSLVLFEILQRVT
ncbi:DUF92 domain-containing protein [Rubrolithibacter danxiaensis]|uniref:DUF92 domain-containing protein n=1 Tax=Rubrolithibacter danxiaensis TaxID=3390805 RepID=UPI003BF81161